MKTTLVVRDYMSVEVSTLSPENSIDEALGIEARRRVRHIPIVDQGKLVGIVTDRDLKRALPSLLTSTERAEYERVTRETPVGRIMTKSPATVAPDTHLRDAVELMHRKKFGAVPVVEAGKLVGILTDTDVLRAFLSVLDGGV